MKPQTHKQEELQQRNRKGTVLEQLYNVLGVCVGGGGAGAGRGGNSEKNFGRGLPLELWHPLCIYIISRLTKHTYSYNLHVKRYPIHIIEEFYKH